MGVGVFAGLTAYDTQRIKAMHNSTDDEASAGRKSVIAALSLYLNFINLFMMMLRLARGAALTHLMSRRVSRMSGSRPRVSLLRSRAHRAELFFCVIQRGLQHDAIGVLNFPEHLVRGHILDQDEEGSIAGVDARCQPLHERIVDTKIGQRAAKCPRRRLARRPRSG